MKARIVIARKISKPTATILLISLLGQLILPNAAYALTSGPSQPEVQSFEPVSTTNLVNNFSGDFIYNIPLLDVEGYPINISYHSGIGMEQEASWVGLGWNINPGNINHIVRGIPDDFDGEKLSKHIEMNDEVRKRFGLLLSMEYVGIPLDGLTKAASMLKLNVGGALNLGVNISNYSGVSASLGMNSSSSISYQKNSTPVGGGAPSSTWFSGGTSMGMAVNTDGSVDIDHSVSGGISKQSQGVNSAISGSFGFGLNSREGLKYVSFGVNPSIPNAAINTAVSMIGGSLGILNPTFVPISYQNYVPVNTFSNSMESNFFQFKLGVEINSIYPHIGGSFGKDEITYHKDAKYQDASRPAYGYFNLEHATNTDILDFTRDRDGRFHRGMSYLPSGNMTYDIFSVNGQGTGGQFRPFRNDIGTVYDPMAGTSGSSRSDQVEAGVGNIFEVGWDRVNTHSGSHSGPWNQYYKKFTGKEHNSLYEPYYFKQAGELSTGNETYYNAIKQDRPLQSSDLNDIPNNPFMHDEDLSNSRVNRTNLLYFFTAKEAKNKWVSLMPKLENYTTLGYPGTHTTIDRDEAQSGRKGSMASEFTQVLPDGKRYVYGIPAMNTKQQEFVVSCNPESANDGTTTINGKRPYQLGPYTSQVIGQDMYLETGTPAFAHTYLLTSVLSENYADVTGDGISRDDMGSYTKFNYSRKNANFPWRAPYARESASYDKGVMSDCHDDRATFILGEKEIWMLHSIETKNFVAEFYVSERNDALGAPESLQGVDPDTKRSKISPEIPLANRARSYKLDSIVLFNIQDRIDHGVNAEPIKKILFAYDYSLCKNVKNQLNANAGKLTLKAIYSKFGNSDIGFLNPYRFTYSGFNPNYNELAKDRWGQYKPSVTTGINPLTNYEYPYVNQNKTTADQNASAWNLTKIQMPSGSALNVSYESDDYAFVQNRRAMEMTKIAGVGPTASFVSGNSLYQDMRNPYLYIYFQRKKVGGQYFEMYPNDVMRSYVGAGDFLQYNFEVDISGGQQLQSCPNTPLKDMIKGYARVMSAGICSNTDYAYVKLEPLGKAMLPQVDLLGLDDAKINPVTMAAINYAKFYNSKALYPSSEILSVGDPALPKQLLNSFSGFRDYFVNPLSTYLAQQRGKFITVDRSYIRLASQGFKLGGGHRVKKIMFNDIWDEMAGGQSQAAVYGSEYDYTCEDENTHERISSGVASYEPLMGGDENPFKEPVAIDRIGKKKYFPVSDPVELFVEGPIGESLYPPAEIGYSKVTVRSIHANEGASSQSRQVYDYYTAKDFPIRVTNTPLEKIEDKQLKMFSFRFNKKEVFRVGQGFSIAMNDMHGKAKMESTYVGAQTDPVAYKKYEYFSDQNRLNNQIPCLSFDQPGQPPKRVMKQIGVEADLTIDSRERIEESTTDGFMANLNVMMAGTIPLPFPSGFPKTPKSHTKIFSSIVSTKVIQEYGILKSVETFDKGAKVVLENQYFDSLTGQVLVSKVNTEHKDSEYNITYPAYWAYRCMGPAYSNIQYEEDLTEAVEVNDDRAYIQVPDPSIYNVGDEVLLTLKRICGINGLVEQTYKLWIKDPLNPYSPLVDDTKCDCDDPPLSEKRRYRLKINCSPSSEFAQGKNHLRAFQDYDAYMHGFAGMPDQSGYHVFDRICQIPSGAILDMCHKQDKKLLDKLFDNQLNQSAGSATSIVSFLKGIDYPVEKFKVSWVHNGDYVLDNHRFLETHYIPSGGGSTMAQSIPYYDDSIRLACNSPWHHGTYKPGNYVFDAVDNDQDDPTEDALYPPINNVTDDPDNPNDDPRYVRFRIKVYRVFDLKFFYHTLFDPTSLTAYVYHIQDPLAPFNSRTNNYYQVNYDFFFPYDVNYATSVNLLNKLNSYVQQFNPTGELIELWEDENAHFNMVIKNPSYNPLIPNSLPYNGISPSAPGKHIAKSCHWKYNMEVIEGTKAQLLDKDRNILALPLKRTTHNTDGSILPSETSGTNGDDHLDKQETILDASVKIIRSGLRNRLEDQVQQVVTTTSPVVNPTTGVVSLLSSFGNVLQASARTFTNLTNTAESQYLKQGINYDQYFNNMTYFNPFVAGICGTFRVMSAHFLNKDRSYNGNISDNRQGYIDAGIQSFWSVNASAMAPKLNNPFNYVKHVVDVNNWYPGSTVNVYSPWGNDLEVRDANGIMHANVFGYANRLPVAITNNAKWSDVLCENFEDETIPEETHNYMYPNDVNRNIYGPSPLSSISLTDISHHSGRKALAVNAISSIDFVHTGISTSEFWSSKSISPFYFKEQHQYVLSYWRKVTPNQLPPASGGISINMGGVSTYAQPQGPPIDGWVRYEAIIETPSDVISPKINFGVGTYDDLRIYPVKSNMKSYVYDSRNSRLLATLDENNMATFYEYDQQGKLARMKRETEKGIITVKEYRESLRRMVGNSSVPGGGGTEDPTPGDPIPDPPPVND